MYWYPKFYNKWLDGEGREQACMRKVTVCNYPWDDLFFIRRIEVITSLFPPGG